jgi:hypothetical protein
MRLYKTDYRDDEVNEPTDKVKWDGTQADASKRRVSLKKEGYRDIRTEEVDVPTDKAGLMAFLNVQ